MKAGSVTKLTSMSLAAVTWITPFLLDDFITSTPTDSPACNPSLARISASVPRDELLILNEAKIASSVSVKD